MTALVVVIVQLEIISSGQTVISRKLAGDLPLPDTNDPVPDGMSLRHLDARVTKQFAHLT